MVQNIWRTAPPSLGMTLGGDTRLAMVRCWDVVDADSESFVRADPGLFGFVNQRSALGV